MKKIFFGALVLFFPFMYAQTVFGLKAGLISLQNQLKGVLIMTRIQVIIWVV